MYRKKVALLRGLTLLAGSILVPAVSSVNRHRTKLARRRRRWRMECRYLHCRQAMAGSWQMGCHCHRCHPQRRRDRTSPEKVFQLGNSGDLAPASRMPYKSMV